MATQAQPNNTVTLDTGLRHHMEGRLDHAAQVYQRLLQDDPRNAEALHLLGVVAHQRGAHGRAIDLIGRALGLQPMEPRFHANLSEAFRAAGDAARAEQFARNALQIAPNVASFHNSLGLALQSQGRHAEAEACFRQSIKVDPNFALAHSNIGVSLVELGRPTEALDAFREAVRLNPDLPEARTNLGQLLLERHQKDEALVHCREAVRLRPNAHEALNNLGNVLRAMGELEEAKGWYARVIQLRPGLAMPYNNMGQALQEEGRLEEATACYQQALRLEPNTARFHCNMASVLHERNMRDESLAHCRHAITLQPTYAEAHLLHGGLHQDQGNLNAALECYREGLRLDPERPAAHIDLGEALAEKGDLEQAQVCFRAALKIDPDDTRGYACLASALRDKMPKEELAALEGLLHRTLPWKGKMALEYSLAHVYDGLGRHAEATTLLVSANAQRKVLLERHGKSYDPAVHKKFVDNLIAKFSEAHFARTRGWGLSTEVPIFIVGMPRSGTTLTEQVLASHPRVYGAGELTYLRESFESMPGLLGLEAEAEDCVERYTPEAVLQAAQRHLDRLREMSPADRVVDKMPDNYLWVGLIATLFPRARIIHCRRDLRDVALSCWRTHFKQIAWSVDMEHLTHRILEYQRIWEHWVRVLPVEVLDVEYEDTVADLEGVARRMLDFCGLEWDPNCLDFHKKDRPIRTASVNQVRQPIYTRSVAKWKHYAGVLAPLLAHLPEEAPAPSPEAPAEVGTAADTPADMDTPGSKTRPGL
jgi:tetratricopeptide (TPR) repeat protein